MEDVNIVNFEGLSNVANNLINKLSSAIGWIASHDTPRKQAARFLVESVEKSDLSTAEKIAVICNQRKIVREYTNQSNIVKKAIQFLDDNAKVQSVDDDWLYTFMDKARLISDEDFQTIWGKLMAEECNEPNSMPKSLLFTLEQMDRYDADIFVDLCSCSVSFRAKDNDDGSCLTPIIRFCEKRKDMVMDFNALCRIESLGLITMDLGMFKSGYSTGFDNFPVIASYFDNEFQFPNGMSEIPVGGVIFTRTGEALSKLVTAKEKPEFFEKVCLPFFQLSSDNYEKHAKYDNQSTNT